MNFSNLEKHISFLAAKDENERNREKLNANLIDVICEVCNNYVLNEVEIKTIFTYIMTVIGKFTVNYVTRNVENKSKEENSIGNEFNLQRWLKFSDEFITEHELTDFRGNRL
ncbi:hypothetical protein GJU43_21155 [Flavobacterium sp. LC2016-23]|uniref:hypothetical protein n=1 Tax=Flavobacterium sp. LC2016-23 TaxID=2666330 RepID=UPI0012B0B20F|nr:hypothetical protein [Flavobacterium sp. LC2016-23]MRX41799.1 hypothetical protein [Flavobacterium sp. LC2016-23]